MLDVDLIFSGVSSFFSWIDTLYITQGFSLLDFIINTFVFGVKLVLYTKLLIFVYAVLVELSVG